MMFTVPLWLWILHTIFTPPVSFNEITDFDPGSGVFNLTSVPDLPGISSGSDMFISKLDGNGNFGWAKQMRTTSPLTYTRQTYRSSIEVDDYGNIYTSGGL